MDDNLKTCPQCNADLEAFQLVENVDKKSKNRRILAIIMSVLFLAIVLVLLFTVVFVNKDSKPDQDYATQIDKMQTEMQNLKSENQKLIAEKKDLENQIKSEEAAQEQRTRTYVVSEGETLYSIARKVYGNGFKYVDLAKDNNISNPDNIFEGQKLIIYY
jgi:cell division protein FtsL